MDDCFLRGATVKYYCLKMKVLPRVSFAVINKGNDEVSECITDNTYTMFRYIDAGQLQITLPNQEKLIVSEGEYVIIPAGVPYEYHAEKDSICSMFCFYLDDGVQKLVEQDEIAFEISDNYVYVDIESLFIPMQGKFSSSEKPYKALRQLIGNYDGEREYVNVTAGVRVAELFVALAEQSLKEIKHAGQDKQDNFEIYCSRVDKYIDKNYRA